MFRAILLPEFKNKRYKDGTNASTVKFASVVSYLDTAIKILSLILACLFCNKIVPALAHRTTSNNFKIPSPDAGTVLLQNIHAGIKFIIFIALSSQLTTPANFTYMLTSK